MDLHVAFAVAIVLRATLARLLEAGVIAQQPSVELCRRHRADDSLRGFDPLSRRRAARRARAPPRLSRLRSTSAPHWMRPPWSAISRSKASSRVFAPPTAIGQPAISTAKAMTLTICGRIGALRIEAAVQAPGRPKRVDAHPRRRSIPDNAAPGAAPRRTRRRARADRASRLRAPIAAPSARPEPAAEQREQEGRVGAHPVHLAREGLAVPFGAGLEGRDVARAVAREQHDATRPAG